MAEINPISSRTISYSPESTNLASNSDVKFSDVYRDLNNTYEKQRGRLAETEIPGVFYHVDNPLKALGMPNNSSLA